MEAATLAQDQLDQGANDGSTTSSVPAMSPEPPTPEATVDPTPPVAPPPPAAAAPQPPAAPSILRPQAPPAQPDDDWEHKYRVLQGMHKKETSDLRAELEQTKAEKDALAQKQVDTGPINLADYGITEAQIEEYGTEYWETQVKIQRNVAEKNAPAQSQGPARDEEMDVLKGQVAQQAKDAYYQRLSVLVPDWETIDSDQRWLDWLAQTDVATGLLNQELLEDAHLANDEVRVAGIFNRYKGIAASAPAPAQPSQPTVDVVPPTHAPAEQGSVARGDTMTFEQWQQEVSRLTSRGLAAEELVEEDNRLQKMMAEGKVTGAPDSKPTTPEPWV
jgi:hypothetical protein